MPRADERRRPSSRGAMVMSAEDARRLDAAAHGDLGLPTLTLMEQAAASLLRAAEGMLGGDRERVLVCCGPGNNGGDGLALARLLLDRVDVTVIDAVPGRERAGDAGVQFGAWRALGGATAAWPDPEAQAALSGAGDGWLVVDALLGTGSRPPPREPMGGLIEAINEAGGRGASVLSVDVPTGVDADTGRTAGPFVRATATVCLAALKPAAVMPGAGGAFGRVSVGSIGLPARFVERYTRPADGAGAGAVP